MSHLDTVQSFGSTLHDKLSKKYHYTNTIHVLPKAATVEIHIATRTRNSEAMFHSQNVLLV